MTGQRGAVAVDMGASSARFALGWIERDRIKYEVIEQIAHEPVQPGSKLLWDTDLLLDLCRRAAAYGRQELESASIGIDTWGVDHGLVDAEGKLLQAPVCYRDPSHVRAMKEVEPHQEMLFSVTGIQRQPFNTLCQLMARAEEDPSLPQKAEWLLLPDLFDHMLGGDRGYELTNASTTQLMGLDCRWSVEAFQICGWPLPQSQPELPGKVIGEVEGVQIIRVGSHDTASAVYGFGALANDEAFLNVGTWSLLGCIVDDPIVTDEARVANFTNERTVGGRVRFLRNIPGFYVLNRLKDELAVPTSMSEWLAMSDQSSDERVDLFDENLFNPDSMVEAVRKQIGRDPLNRSEWAGIALLSLAEETARQLRLLEEVTGRSFSAIRMGGGASASDAFCQSIADTAGVPVLAGPTEATLLGNLALQLQATGEIADSEEAAALLRASADVRPYHPRE